jgi:hypothetical protein
MEELTDYGTYWFHVEARFMLLLVRIRAFHSLYQCRVCLVEMRV